MVLAIIVMSKKYATFNSYTACQLKEINFKSNLDIEKNTQNTTKTTPKQAPRINQKHPPKKQQSQPKFYKTMLKQSKKYPQLCKSQWKK